jgi:hypothetical protein
MNCSLCGATALYISGGLRFCKFHRKDAIAREAAINQQIDRGRVDRERDQKFFDKRALQHRSASHCSSFR